MDVPCDLPSDDTCLSRCISAKVPFSGCGRRPRISMTSLAERWAMGIDAEDMTLTEAARAYRYRPAITQEEDPMA